MDRKTDRNLAWCLFIMGMMILWLLADVWSDGWHTGRRIRALESNVDWLMEWKGRIQAREAAEIFRQHEAAQRKK
jgi:hypothetical protein